MKGKQITVKKGIIGVLSMGMLTMTMLSNVVVVHAEHPVQASVHDDKIIIENDTIKREYAIQDDHILTSSIDNKRANTTLTPQAGSEDFLINLLPQKDTPGIIPEITNDPQYILEGSESALDRRDWKATLQNKDGVQFAKQQVDLLFDGDLQTNVDNYKVSGSPFTLSIDLGSSQHISSMTVNKRPGYKDQAYGLNGTMGGYIISVKQNERDDWIKIKEGAFSADDYNLHKEQDLYNVGDTVFVNFTPTDARYVQIQQTSTAFGTAQEFSSAEINLYEKELKKVQKIVEPKQVLDRSNWAITMKNSKGEAFDEAAAKSLIDHDLRTYPNDTTKSGNPFTVDIDFGKKQAVSSISIDKRPGYSDKAYGINGTLGEFALYISDDGKNWQIAGAGNFTKDAYGLHQEGDLYNVGNRVYANFLKTYTTRYVRLVQTSCSMGNTEEFTSAELNVYSDPYVGPNWNTEVHNQTNPSAIQSSKLIYKNASVENTKKGKKITIFYEPYRKDDVTYTIDQVVVLEEGDHFLRSFIEIRVSDKDKAQIDYIDQDHFVLPKDASGVWSHPDDSKISSQWIGAHELMLGQPIYANGFFMGSEFPATDTIIKNNETQIRYYSGKTFTKLKEDGQLTKDGKFVSWQNVIGAARGTDIAVVQTDFFDYIEQIATPTEFRKQYNSWYDNMMNITDDSIAKSFYGAEQGLTSNGVAPLDAYVVDDGWNNYYDGTYTATPGSSQGTTKNQTGFWEFNAKFPNELYTSSSLSNKLLSSFGLWVGPQGGYNYFNTFAQYLESIGTGFVQSNSALGKVVCTGSKKYLTNFTNRFLDYQQRFDIDYWKWDGFASRPCNNPNHDHMTGGDHDMYFTTDMWEGWIQVFQTMRADRAKQGKDLFINATCYINLSPWLLQWVNTIWVQDSGDTGQLGSGARHQQKITYRDEVYYKLLKQNQVQFPLKNIYNHDPIYGVSDGSEATTDVFREYLMANAVRGTAFWELYYSPSIFDDAKWKVNADVLDFAQTNHEILKHAKLFGNEPAKGVYGYASWLHDEGIMSFTNPLDTEQTYTLKVDEKIGANPTLKNASGIQVQPYQEGVLAQKLSYGDNITVTLAPHETRILQYGHKDTNKPTLLSAKVTGDKQITLKFSERVSKANVYEVDKEHVASELKDDYRTVVLTCDKAFSRNADVHVNIQGIQDAYGNTANIKTTLTAYKDGIIASVASKDDVKDGGDIIEITQASTKQNFMKMQGEKVINTQNALSGTQDFAISLAVKTDAVNTSFVKQGKDLSLGIDSEGYAVFKVNNTTITSKEKITTVDEKAHGIFGSDAYVPTTTKDRMIGKINDNTTHTLTAVKEPNGMLKLYVDGSLSSSAYDKATMQKNVEKDVLTIGGPAFKGYLSNVQLKNNTVSYEEAASLAASYGIGVHADLVDRANWKASASSQMNGTVGDSTAMAAIDGNTNTWWHTDYTGGDHDPVDKHWIAIDFGKAISFDNFIYMGRGGANGDIKDFELEGKINGQWETLKKGTFSNQVTNVVPMGKTVTASAIRLRSITTQNGNNFAAAVEINVSKNREASASTSDIDKLKTDAIPITTTDYTKASADAYQTVYKNIQQLDDINTTAKDVVVLRSQFDAARTNLVSVKSLRDTISKTETFAKEHQNIFTPVYYDRLRSVIADAKAMLQKEDATADEIKQKEKALHDIVTAAEYQTVDKTVLLETLKKAQALVNTVDLYTSDSLTVLKNTMMHAENIIKDEKASQKAVDAAVESIQTAITKLQKLNVDIPKTPDNHINTNHEEVNTGDTSGTALFIGCILVSFAAIAILRKRKHRGEC